MASVEWSEELSVGIALIDAQHRQFLELIGSIEVILEAGGEPEMLKLAFDALLEYATVHFAAEEELLTVHAYPELLPHIAEHDLFVLKLNTLRRQFAAGEEQLGANMLEYLVLWLRNHIMTTDQAYAPYLRDRIGA